MSIEFRTLNRDEHQKTRALWEDIFVEDTGAFLDYYYKVKAADNEIYTAWEGNEIRAMLQLNPYHIQIGETTVDSHYIIAVATDARYRKRGLMAELLKSSMRAMYDRREPFAFLMPAAEAIYYPFDFRYVYAQAQETIAVNAAIQSPKNIEVIRAQKCDCGALARFAMTHLKEHYGTYAVRDEHYYETMLAEQQSEGGGIAIIHALVDNSDIEKDKWDIAGCFLFAGEDEMEIREPMMCEGQEDILKYAIGKIVEGRSPNVMCRAYGTAGKKPVIMARILCLETLLSSMKVKGEMQCTVWIEDPLIVENNGAFTFSGQRDQSLCITMAAGNVTKQNMGCISIAALTSFLFGYKTLQESLEEECNPISNDIQEELEKIIPISPIFLNEIV